MALSNLFKASTEFQMTSGPAVSRVTLVVTWSDTFCLPSLLMKLRNSGTPLFPWHDSCYSQLYCCKFCGMEFIPDSEYPNLEC